MSALLDGGPTDGVSTCCCGTLSASVDAALAVVPASVNGGAIEEVETSIVGRGGISGVFASSGTYLSLFSGDGVRTDGALFLRRPITVPSRLRPPNRSGRPSGA